MEAQQGKELRIGNYINYKDENHLFEVVAIDDLGVRVKDDEQITWIEYDCFDPITLNEKEILKFGAKKHDEVVYLPIPNLKAELHFEFYENEVVAILKSQFCELILDPIKYAHRLQNLFYVLSGEELKITK